MLSKEPIPDIFDIFLFSLSSRRAAKVEPVGVGWTTVGPVQNSESVLAPDSQRSSTSNIAGKIGRYIQAYVYYLVLRWSGVDVMLVTGFVCVDKGRFSGG